MKNLSLVFAAFIAIVLSCGKDPQPKPMPAIWGDWYTLPTTGFLYDYSFFKGGKGCATLPDFPQFQQCWDIEQKEDTVFFKGENRKTWVWKFEADNVALIQDFTNTQTFVIVRK